MIDAAKWSFDKSKRGYDMDLLMKIIRRTAALAVILVILFFIIPSKPVSMQDYEYAGVTARKQCISFMKVIEGSAELYRLENSVTSEIKMESPRLLNEMKYLKLVTRCSMNKDKDYTLTVPAGNSTIEVECPTHGKLSEVDTTGLEKGIRKRSFFEKLFLDKVSSR